MGSKWRLRQSVLVSTGYQVDYSVLYYHCPLWVQDNQQLCERERAIASERQAIGQNDDRRAFLVRVMRQTPLLDTEYILRHIYTYIYRYIHICTYIELLFINIIFKGGLAH